MIQNIPLTHGRISQERCPPVDKNMSNDLLKIVTTNTDITKMLKVYRNMVTYWTKENQLDDNVFVDESKEALDRYKNLGELHACGVLHLKGIKVKHIFLLNALRKI